MECLFFCYHSNWESNASMMRKKKSQETTCIMYHCQMSHTIPMTVIIWMWMWCKNHTCLGFAVYSYHHFFFFAEKTVSFLRFVGRSDKTKADIIIVMKITIIITVILTITTIIVKITHPKSFPCSSGWAAWPVSWSSLTTALTPTSSLKSWAQIMEKIEDGESVG